jgi:ribokinase
MAAKQIREWDVAVVGGAYTDYLIQGPCLPRPGQTVVGKSFLASAGGKGANQAVAAARLHARTALIGRIGDDERGEMLLEQLEIEGVSTRHLIRDDTAPTGVALVVVDEHGQKQIVTAPGANHLLSIEDIESAAPTIAASFVLLAQLEVPLECVLAAVRMAREAGARVVLDPSPSTDLPDELLASVDVLRVNGDDAERLTGIPVHDRDSARSAAKMLLARRVGAVALEAGDPGNLLVWQEGECWLPKLAVKTVDATGAGDAFSAALAVAMAEGHTLTEAGPFANAAAAHATTALGAQTAMPRRRELYGLLARSTKDQTTMYHPREAH